MFTASGRRTKTGDEDTQKAKLKGDTNRRQQIAMYNTCSSALVGMDSAAPAAAVALKRQGDPNCP